MTREWFRFLSDYQTNLKNQWSAGLFVGATMDETIQRNAHAIGAVDLINELTEITYEDFTESLYDNK
jgi:hypothetical protein